VFEGVAFRACAEDPALDEDCLHEGNDGEGDVEEDVGSAWIGWWNVLVVDHARRVNFWRTTTGEGESREYPSYQGPSE
jgi:hypothetical protein